MAEELLRLAWDEFARTRDPHFLSSARRPEPWLKLFFLLAAGGPGRPLEEMDALPWTEVPVPEEAPLDRVILDCALRAMCLHDYQEQLAWRVARRLPDRPITIDLAACRVGCGERTYLFPPSPAARLRERARGYTVHLSDLSALDDLAAALLDGTPHPPLLVPWP
jgi:hypothetical protein